LGSLAFVHIKSFLQRLTRPIHWACALAARRMRLEIPLTCRQPVSLLGSLAFVHIKSFLQRLTRPIHWACALAARRMRLEIPLTCRQPGSLLSSYSVRLMFFGVATTPAPAASGLGARGPSHATRNPAHVSSTRIARTVMFNSFDARLGQ